MAGWFYYGYATFIKTMTPDSKKTLYPLQGFAWDFSSITISCVIAISMYYAWFLSKGKGKQPVEVMAE